MRRCRRKVKRFISLCISFHRLDDIAVMEENGCVWLSESVYLCVFAPSGGDDKILNVMIGLYEFTKLPVSVVINPYPDFKQRNTLQPLFSLIG